MKIASKKTSGLSSPLYDSGNIVGRDNYVSISGGMENSGNKSDDPGSYSDTANKTTATYDVAVPSLIDVVDTLKSQDKPD